MEERLFRCEVRQMTSTVGCLWTDGCQVTFLSELSNGVLSGRGSKEDGRKKGLVEPLERGKKNM